MKFVESAKPYVLSLYRIVLGLLFASDGAAKLFGVLGVDAVRPGEWPGWYAGIIELVGGFLVIIGFFTRVAALICSGEMAFAYFTVHQPKALWPLQNEGELAAAYSWAFLMIAVMGPGAWALDTWLSRTRARGRVTPPSTA
ncbi:DoxX family protein [Nonomuraea mangrovi]|uniref:DoxX family protein n=1 Tax=Nonomuraea mangrovi TaxID=2316207 RepID=A0ABW4T279_9ACTN